MASALTYAQIEAKQRLQRVIAAAVAAAWKNLPHYDRGQVDQWLATVLPLTAAANRQSVMLTQAFIARAAKAQPQPVDAQQIIAGIRNGTPPEEVYSRPFVTVWGALKRGTPWAEAVRMGLDRATGAAVTDVQLSFTHTVQAVGSMGDRIAGYQRVPDSGACDFCEAAAEQVYKSGDLMPLHRGCVTGDTLVIPPCDGTKTGSLGNGHAVTRRWYAGEIVVLKTASGRNLTLTPNHPVLTDRGWVAAHLLREGDGVIGHVALSGIHGGIPEEQHVPARIEERFSARSVASLVSVPFSAEHFHGDIGNSEVDVVLPDRDLEPRTLAALLKPREYALLTFRSGLLPHRERLCAAHRRALVQRSASKGRIGRGGASAALGGSLPSGTDSVLLGGTAERYPGEDEMPPDRAPVNAVALRESEHGLPGEIALDSVRHTSRINWQGHVYNLVTEPGWYVANGIVTHNCGCGAEPVFASDLRSPVTPAPDTFAGPDGLTVAVRQHGELGPVLTNKADHFDGPGSIPHPH